MSSSHHVRILMLGLLLTACGGDSGSAASTPAGERPGPSGTPAGDEVDPSAAGTAPDDTAPVDDDDAGVVIDGDDGEEAGADEPEIAGKLVPPPAESLTVHALAAYEVVTVYAEPNLASTKLGYLRFGHRTMVTPKVDDQGEGCNKGWHGLPAGGYTCASKGLTVDPDKEPYMHQPPPRPRIEDPMPYDYGAIARDGTETWWRTADALERELAAERFAILQEQAAAAAAAAAAADGSAPVPPPAPKKKPKAPTADDGGAPTDGGDLPSLPGIDDPVEEPPAPPTAEELAEQARKEAEAKAKAEAQRLREEEDRKLRLQQMSKLPLHPENPFLERGFTITMALKVVDKGRTWWRTSRGGYIDANKVFRKPKPAVVELGVQLPEGAGFPFGFVDDDKAAVYQKNDDGRLQWVRSLPKRAFVGGVEQLEIDGKSYLRTAEDTYVRASSLRVAEPQPVPTELGGTDRWIDVDLAQQLLVAYEGERPVFATLVSTGRKGPKDEPFDTPKGTFRIVTKHISSSMDGNTASDGNYSIQDVPWAMFFHGNYALHGAFWHNGFGARRSHGCINLAVADARWLFWWAGPELPEGWHGAATRDESPGSVVVVR